MPLIGTTAGIAADAYGLFAAPPAVWKALQIVGSSTLWTGFGFKNLTGALVSGTTNNLAQVASLTASGVFNYQKQSSTLNSNWGSVDGSGNQLISMRGTGLPILAKIATDGSVTWARILSGGSNSNWRNATSSGGNTFIAYGQGLQNHQLLKYNSSGTIQWVRNYGISGYTLNFNAFVAIDSSENAFIANDLQNNSDSLFGTSLVRYNTSGTIQWQRFINTSTDRLIPTALATDNTGNALISVRNRNSNIGAVLIKVNTSGTVSWSRQLNGTTVPSNVSIACDSSDAVYIANIVSGNTVIQKYDSSGTAVWQRKMTNVNNPTLSVSGTTLYITGATASNTLTTFAMLTDGTDTGTYTINGTNYVYSSSTDLTSSTWSGTNFSTSSGTDSTGSLTDTSTTVTLSNSTYTASKI